MIKIFKLLFAFVVIVLVIFLGYKLYLKYQITKGWSTYNNDLVPVSFKYPPYLKVDTNSGSLNFNSTTGKWMIQLGTGAKDKKNLSVYSDLDDESYDQFLINIKKETGQFKGETFKEINLNGHRAFQDFIPVQPESVFYQYRTKYTYMTVVEIDGKGVIFTAVWPDSSFEKDYGILINTITANKEVKK